MVTPTPIPGT